MEAFWRPVILRLVSRSCVAWNRLCNSSEPMAAVIEDTPSKHPMEDADQSDAKRQKVLLEDNDINETKTKAKAKKMAMCMTYNGKGYLGMQRNPGAKTIEEDLLQAMYRAQLLSQDQLDSPQSIMFQRAARTDKGVSAVRQVLSLKLPTNIPAETMVENINNELCHNIRVIGIKRTTRGFNSKNNCDARTYSYILPSFAFAHPDVTASVDYRISGGRLEEVNRILSLYKGCHNFHNFTSGKRSQDPSAMRYIITCECSQPFEQVGLEFVQIQLKGQSFMLHQIRKMVALVIAIMRGYTSESTIRRAWGPEKLDIPIAPALGLMLEEVHYERYNQKYGGDGLHEPLTWTEKQDIIHTFKETHIYPTILETENEEQSMLNWMESLQMHTYDIREAGPPSVVAINKSHEVEDGTSAGDVNGLSAKDNTLQESNLENGTQ